MPSVVTVVTGSQHAQLSGTCARVPVLPKMDQMPVTFLLGNHSPEESYLLLWFFMAYERKVLSGTLGIFVDIQKPGT